MFGQIKALGTSLHRTARTAGSGPSRSAHTRRAVVAGALALGGVALTVPPASALTYQANRGPYDMRGFVRNGNPAFGCGTGSVTQGSMTVSAPSNYGVRVYSTTYVYRWVNGAWVNSGVGGSVQPGGQWVPAGTSYTFHGWSLATASGYWYTYMQADFHSSTGAELGAVDIKPTLTTDWNSSYRYATGAYSYCWHG